jgi:hypothetical protein
VPLRTRVSADPTDPDGDADSYLDSQEKIYGFHPRAPSQTSILTLDSQLAEWQGGTWVPTDKYVKPGDSLQYEATVRNELNAREAQGLLWTEGSAVLDRSGIAPQSFVLMPQEEKAMQGGLGVASSAPSGAYSLTQVAGALITERSEISGDADLWLPFDDATTATTYADASGSIPANNGYCVGPVGSCSIVEAGGRYGSAVQLNGQGYVTSDARTSATAFAASLWFKLPAGGDLGDYGLFRTDATLGPRVWAQVWDSWPAVCIVIPTSASEIPICSGSGEPGPPLNDGRWHQVVSSCSGNSVQIYFDGSPVLASPVGSCGEAGAVRFGAAGPEFSRFPGQIDDVRLYPRGLSAQEVHDLYYQPVFSMNFEQHTAWTDTGGHPTPVTCSGATCPSHDSLGATGWGAAFDGSDNLSVGAAYRSAPEPVGRAVHPLRVVVSGFRLHRQGNQTIRGPWRAVRPILRWSWTTTTWPSG